MYKPRSKPGFFTTILTAGAVLFGGSGCIANSIGYVPSPSDLEQRVSDYQERRLREVAVQMGLYDPEQNQYNADAARAAAEEQLQTRQVGNQTRYINLGDSEERLLATRQALEALINQYGSDEARQAEVAELTRLRDQYAVALRKFHGIRGSNQANSIESRRRDFLTVETFAYGSRDFDLWERARDRRVSLLGRDLGDRDNYGWIAERYPDEVRAAHNVRRERQVKTGVVATLGALAIYLLCQDDENGGSAGGDIGGETGGPGGRGCGIRF
jgi:hypothetical protein